MYKIELIKAENQEACDDELDFIFQDIANSISNIQQVESANREGNFIWVETASSVDELKKAMRHIFSHHFDFVRLSSIETVK